MVGGRYVGSLLDVPHGTKLVPRQALAKPVPGSFAAQWCPELASEPLVNPAVTAIMMVWKSACGVLQHAVHALLSLPQAPVCQPTVKCAVTGCCRRRHPASWGRLYPSTWMESRWLSSLPFTSKPWKGPGRPRWPPCKRFGVSGKTIRRKEGCPPHRRMGNVRLQVAGTLGMCAPFSGVVSELLGLTGWFCDATPHSLKEFQILAGRWSRCFQFRRDASCAFSHLWSAIYSNARPQPTLEIVMDLLGAICLLPLLRFNTRYRVNPLLIATDASESLRPE